MWPFFMGHAEGSAEVLDGSSERKIPPNTFCSRNSLLFFVKINQNKYCSAIVIAFIYELAVSLKDEPPLNDKINL
jgi:hypothetical protein